MFLLLRLEPIFWIGASSKKNVVPISPAQQESLARTWQVGFVCYRHRLIVALLCLLFSLLAGMAVDPAPNSFFGQ